jgi:hypothetical protein
MTTMQALAMMQPTINFRYSAISLSTFSYLRHEVRDYADKSGALNRPDQ